MDRDEIETTLKAAFLQCEALFCPLNEQQKEILLEVFFERNSLADGNPLDELTSMQREILLEFILKQERENLAWKSSLLNDWLNDRPSGAVQFIRDRYGLAWLNTIKPIHWQEYLQKLRLTREKLQVGDAIEVSNGLWEWIPADAADSCDWFPCEVIEVKESEDDSPPVSCRIRFQNGEEWEIQAIYRWNRPNWRFLT
ncbi:hypothetical protein [Microcystis aeruginosa]|uniref:hypothetical protein n=1 Tax=Microcystis aeruginosa TaxID=1126 RepID=UPI00232AB060|nr:hypothetical protein [Microcystis aeruginosa]MDB9434696.1 hypothetical protein [Microcystis aeruginosa CS-552/01]